MLPILAQLGLALVSAKMQSDEARKQHERAQQQQLDQTLAGIDAKRASRAGDSGYMQTAISGMDASPSRPKSAAGPMLAQLGTAMLAQSPEPNSVQTSSQGRPSSEWAGGDWKDEDKYRNIA